ncbi:MAG TPA: NAD(P)/FAD-dependent oxidoreductase [bacterium]|nr:NAD(P)/FAD-dependent oxidoreductase [bacterium]
MLKTTYDIVIVGGGLGGSTFAKVMAESGARVLVLERETRFRDRVRGEAVHPWGVIEATRLGIADLLQSTCAHTIPWFERYRGETRVLHHDLVAQYGAPELKFYHPAMQEALLQAAADAGACVRRGVHVRDVRGGAPPEVTAACDGGVETWCPRLVVAADGRNSLARRWGKFSVRRDPKLSLIAGLLFDGMPAPTDWVRIFTTQLDRAVLCFPQGNGRVRLYYVHRYDVSPLRGEADVPHFVAAARSAGAPAQLFAEARPAGPLATFDTADRWVNHPYGNGVVLIGDAAATNDPTNGDGMSLTLRDARVLRDCLRHDADWDTAAHAYAAEHDRYYGVLHAVQGWFRELFRDLGPDGEARRARVLPLHQQDPSRIPDHIFGGPDLPFNETIRRRFFGEE